MSNATATVQQVAARAIRKADTSATDSTEEAYVLSLCMGVMNHEGSPADLLDYLKAQSQEATANAVVRAETGEEIAAWEAVGVACDVGREAVRKEMRQRTRDY